MNEWSYYKHIDRVADRFGASIDFLAKKNEIVLMLCPAGDESDKTFLAAVR